MPTRGKPRTRIVKYKNYEIVQVVTYCKGTPDGDGHELKTTIEELPNYIGFDAMYWLDKDMQTNRIENALSAAKRTIDLHLKKIEPDLYEKLGFE